MPIADAPLSNKQHAVPQNVMNVEFKLIGDLTMRQFSYVFIGGIAAYLSYVIFIGIFRWPLVIIIALTGIGLAFVPIQERGMDEWLVNFFKAMFIPTQRVWKKEPTLPTPFQYDDLTIVRQELIALAPTTSRRKLEEYLKYEDTASSVDPLDIPEKEYAQKVRDAYPNIRKSSQAPASEVTEVSATGTSGSDVSVTVEEDFAPEAEVEQSLSSIGTESARLGEPDTAKTVEQAQEFSKKGIEEGGEKEKLAAGAEQRTSQSKQISARFEKSDKPSLLPGAPASGSGKEKKQELVPIIKSRDRGFTPSEVSVSPMTPDMHSGRRFTNLLPVEGELILPIRGERVLRTSEQISVDESINEKAAKLRELLRRIKEEDGIKIAKVKETTVPVVEKEKQQVQEVHDEAKSLAELLKGQREEVTDEINRIKQNIQTTETPGTSSETQKRLLHELEDKRKSLEDNFRVIEGGLKNLKGEDTVVDAAQYVKPEDGGFYTTKAKPNTLYGSIKDKEGKSLTNALLIIKNDREEPVRALKTDSLGRFELLSALTNGIYTIEVRPEDETKLSFDKISVELKGEVVPPLVVAPK